MNKCLLCNGELKSRYQIKFCSNKCQKESYYLKYISEWKRAGTENYKFTRTKNISKHIKRYLIERFGEKCSLCGWDKKHPKTDRAPIEVDHIDGNSLNNHESNLRLLCPNCHSLTDNFRNLNKGRGRKWRISLSGKK